MRQRTIVPSTGDVAKAPLSGRLPISPVQVVVRLQNCGSNAAVSGLPTVTVAALAPAVLRPKTEIASETSSNERDRRPNVVGRDIEPDPNPLRRMSHPVVKIYTKKGD